MSKITSNETGGGSSGGGPVVSQAGNRGGASQSSSGGGAAAGGGVIDRRRLQDLVKEVDPLEQLEEDVEEVMLNIADNFIESVVTKSCQLAKHRKSNTLEAKDVQLCLEKNYNIWVPGFGSDDLRPYKKANVTEAHRQRLALIRKTLKKS